jgi:hypothetical protein
LSVLVSEKKYNRQLKHNSKTRSIGLVYFILNFTLRDNNKKMMRGEKYAPNHSIPELPKLHSAKNDVRPNNIFAILLGRLYISHH